MKRLFSFEDIKGRGTCWVEFQASDNAVQFEHWYADAKFADPIELALFYEVAGKLRQYNQYGPNLFENHELGDLIEEFTLVIRALPALDSSLEEELLFHLKQWFKQGKVLWVLGV